MHRWKFFSTVVSSGLLLIPFACGQFPGKNTVDGGEGNGAGINLELASVTQDSPPTETKSATQASGTCNSPVQLVGLSSQGPYIPVTIDNVGPYNLAISFEEEGTYIFSSRFCREVLRRIDPARCFATADISETNPDIDIDENVINPGEDEIEFKYFTQSSEVRIGTESGNVFFKNYPTRVIRSFEAEGSGAEYLETRFGSREIHGIIGLKNSGDFIQTLSSVCKGSGWGINIQSGSFFSFGGIDVQASSIGTNDTSSVVDFASIYSGEIRPITTNFPSAPSNKFTKHVRLDSMTPFNVVPQDIIDAVESGFAAGSSVDIKIAGVTFNIPWTSLVKSGPKPPAQDDTLVLGTPFFENIYAAMLPGRRQNIVFASGTGSGIPDFKPFSEIETNIDLPTKTQPESSPSGNPTSQPSESTSSNSRVDSSNDNEPNGSPAMVKSNSNNIGAIVGGVVGGVAVLILIIVGACCLYRRRKLMKGSPRGVEKEYEADFDAEIGHHDGFFPQFKESGYATLPTPPPPPGQTRPQVPSLMLESPTNLQYDTQTEYTPSLHPYHDDSPSRSLNVTPLPPPAQTPILTIPPVPERRLSITPSLSIEPPSPLSRNVSAASRQNFPSITQLQRNRSNVRAVPEEEDDYDVVSMASGPTYHNPILASQEASSSAPRLPFMHRSENDRGMGMTDRGAGL